MNNNKEFINTFIHIATYVYGESEPILPYAGAKIPLIGLLFLHAIMNNPELANVENKEEYSTMLSFTGKFFSSSNYDESLLQKTLDMIGKKHNLPSGFFEVAALKKYLSEHLLVIRENLNLTDLPSDVDYKMALVDLISRPQNSKDLFNTYQYYSNESLQQLTAKILDVQPTETFMDCCCGMFSSALYNNAANYIGIEQNKAMASIAAMVLIMCKKKFQLKLGNFGESKFENIADKIFADISYGMALPNADMLKAGKNSEVYCIANTIKSLKDGGLAVIACHGSVLVKQDISSRTMRDLVTKDHLKAIIALPPMDNDSKNNTNLIVLQKNCHAKEIQFINASDFEIENEKRMTLKESDISEIVKCLQGKESTCLAKKIQADDILNSSSCSWSPNNYVQGEKRSNHRSIEEIDKELAESYKELKELFLD